MEIIIIKDSSGQVMSVNRTLDGCSLEAVGLDIETIGGMTASRDILRQALSEKPSVIAEDSEGERFTFERHFLGS